jgi:lipopolysaccharide export system protein LptC
MSAARHDGTVGMTAPASGKTSATHGALPLRAGPSAAAHRAHKRKVSLMRMLFPTAAAVLVAVVAIWSQWQSIESGFKIGFSRINPDEAKTLRMVNPRFSGTNKKAQPFLLTADEARRTSPSAESILLTNPKGDITTDGGAWLALTAAHGNYAQKKKILDLGGGVDLFHDNGLHFTTTTARIDLKAGTADGNDPVTGNGPSIAVTGQGFKLLNGGKTVIFTGKSTAVLYPRDNRKPKAPPKRQKQ